MAILRLNKISKFTGLSTDTKPTGVEPGSEFWEYDTNIVYATYDGTTWVSKDVNSMVLPQYFDLQQAAATYDLWEATVGAVYCETLSITLPNVDCSDDVSLTSISIQTDMAIPDVILSAADGAKANLTPLASFTYSGPAFPLTLGNKIQLTIAGGAADDPTSCLIRVRYRAITPLAYLV